MFPGSVYSYLLDAARPGARGVSGARPSTLLDMKGIRAFLKGLPGGHRPPTGPLTTSEAAEAEELRQETLAKDEDRIEHEQAEAGRESDSSSS